jgi:hypothetical protein
MMAEAEYDRARTLAARNRLDPHYRRVCEVVAADPASPTALDLLRMREHRLFRGEFRVSDCIGVLGEIFTE